MLQAFRATVVARVVHRSTIGFLVLAAVLSLLTFAAPAVPASAGAAAAPIERAGVAGAPIKRAGVAGAPIKRAGVAGAPIKSPGAAGARIEPLQAPKASAHSVVDAVWQTYAREFSSATSDVERLVALYRLTELREFLPQQSQVTATFKSFDADTHLHPLVRAEVEAVLADQLLRQGDTAAAAEIWTRLGFLKHWRAVGPFDNSSPEAVTMEAGPEKGTPDLAASYPGKQRAVRWRQLPFPSNNGAVNLSLYFTPAQSASAYLVTWVRSPRAQDVALRLIESGSSRLWVNHELLFEERGTHRAAGFDMHTVPAHLNEGWNEFLVKDGAIESSNWRFGLRVTTLAGEPLALASQDSCSCAIRGLAPSELARVRKLEAADLTAQAKRETGTPAGQLRYAWVLSRKSNFNAGDNLDVYAFEAAIALAPRDTRALLDYAEHDRDESRRFRHLLAVLALDPPNTEALVTRGWVELSRREFWPARDDFQAALAAAGTPSPADAPVGERIADPRAALGLFETYAGFGITPVAVQISRRLAADGYGGAPAVANAVEQTLERLGIASEARRWAEFAAANDRSNTRSALALANLQRLSGDFQGALRTIQAEIAINPEFPLLYQVEARSLAGLGRSAEAMAAIHNAELLDTDNPALRATAGELARQFGRQENAIANWQLALKLNPQDSDLRDRLRLVRGTQAGESFERPYRIELADAMQRYKRDAAAQKLGGPLLELADTEVVRIFPSGNSGRYVQQIFRVNNDSGANELSTYSVTYDPATEDVRYLTARVVHQDGTLADAPEPEDAVVNESVGYETFYDVRNKYVRMPAIRPGDVVEIAYRTMPTTLESLYGDYFGEVAEFGGDAAKLFQQLVVITPANKALYYQPVRFKGEFTINGAGQNAAQQRSLGAAAADHVYRWAMRDIPAIIAEPNAPPEIELMPYVEVSSFKDWDQFAHWYMDLIRDTFVLDDDLRQTTDRLIAGAKTPEQKVDAIYSYVIRNTHYVALELGIHGYRPYPVTQVFHRRFGDCKDKASLLIAMLARAGVPSDLVLVRVRERGLVDPKIPNVADFDHAIVYVPSLNRYLDGTAEYNGAQELPGSDQRAFVLRIPIEAAALPAANTATATADTNTVADPPAAQSYAPVVTPELPPSANITTRQLNGTLDDDGTLQFSQNMTISGEDAPLLRHAMQLQQRRAGVLQSMLHTSLPGISVTSVDARYTDDYDRPAEVHFTGSIPRFASVVPGNRELLIPRELVTVPWLPKVASLPERQYDLLLGPPQRTVEDLRISLPTGFRVSVPPDFNLDSKFAHVQAAARLDGNTLNMHSVVEIRQSHISASEYPQFRQFWARVDEQLGRPLRAVVAGNAGAF